MSVQALNHIGIAVRSIDDQVGSDVDRRRSGTSESVDDVVNRLVQERIPDTISLSRISMGWV